MSRNDSGKYKRIRNSSRVKVAPSTIRGKITGPEFEASAHILPEQDWKAARKTIAKKVLADADLALLKQEERIH